MLCSLLGTVSQGVMPCSAQKQVGDRGHSILGVRILERTAQWWSGPVHPVIVAQETVSSVPAVRTPKATLRQRLLRAAPLGCPSELRASLLHREVGAGECRQIPSPGPQGCWPCWLPAKALPVLALSHTESRPGHSLQGTRTWPSWLSLDYQQGHLRSRAPPRVSWAFRRGHRSAASPCRLRSLAGVAPAAARSVPAVRVQRTRPETAALSKLLQPAARDPRLSQPGLCTSVWVS